MRLRGREVLLSIEALLSHLQRERSIHVSELEVLGAGDKFFTLYSDENGFKTRTI
jgi:hypothetical protein